jgi:hypothetical protein
MARPEVTMSILALLVSMFFAMPARPAAPTTPAFDKMKMLVGEWKATVPEMGEVHSSFSIKSGGSSLIEEITEPDGTSMITVYYPQNGGVAMTHYCSAHNQPHMFAKLDGDSNVLSYKMTSIDNLAQPGDAHMSGVTFTFKDSDHFSAAWKFEVGGKGDAHPFEFTRVK